MTSLITDVEIRHFHLFCGLGGGNAVPPQAAQAIADLMGDTLLRSMAGETFKLSELPVWVQPVAIALSVKPPAVLS